MIIHIQKIGKLLFYIWEIQSSKVEFLYIASIGAESKNRGLTFLFTVNAKNKQWINEKNSLM